MIIAKLTSTGYILAKACGCKEGTSVETRAYMKCLKNLNKELVTYTRAYFCTFVLLECQCDKNFNHLQLFQPITKAGQLKFHGLFVISPFVIIHLMFFFDGNVPSKLIFPFS